MTETVKRQWAGPERLRAKAGRAAERKKINGSECTGRVMKFRPVQGFKPGSHNMQLKNIATAPHHMCPKPMQGYVPRLLARRLLTRRLLMSCTLWIGTGSRVTQRYIGLLHLLQWVCITEPRTVAKVPAVWLDNFPHTTINATHLLKIISRQQ